MNRTALRIAIRQEEAWDLLTTQQRQAVELYIEESANVSAVARRMDVARQTVMKHLRLAGKKFLAFAEAITRPDETKP